MSKQNINDDDHMHDDESHEDGEAGRVGGIMRTIKDKIGFGTVALGLVVVAIIFLGARDKLMSYFVRQPAIAEQAQAASMKEQPEMQSEMQPTMQAESVAPSAQQSANTQAQPAIAQVQPSTAQVQPANTQAMATAPAMANAPAIANGTNSTAMSDDQVKATIKDFIMNNPTVILDSINKFQQQQNDQRAQDSKAYLSSNADTLVSGKPFIGNKDGNLVITEFFDYRCGYCKKVYPDLIKLVKEYPNLKIVLVEVPFAGPASTKAVQFSLAVNALYPEQFYDFHTALLNAAAINDDTIYSLIAQYKMDKAKLMEKANSDAIEQMINQNIQQATKAGIQGVPSFLINGEFVQGAVGYNEFKKKLDAPKKNGARS